MFPSDQQQPPKRAMNDEEFRQFAANHLQWAANWRRENQISSAWLHWEYSPEEWAQFDAIDYRLRRRALTCLLIGLPLALCVALIFLAAGQPGAAAPSFWGIALVTLAVFGLSGLGDAAKDAKRRHQARPSAARSPTKTPPNGAAFMPSALGSPGHRGAAGMDAIAQVYRELKRRQPPCGDRRLRECGGILREALRRFSAGEAC